MKSVPGRGKMSVQLYNDLVSDHPITRLSWASSLLGHTAYPSVWGQINWKSSNTIWVSLQALVMRVWSYRVVYCLLSSVIIVIADLQVGKVAELQ